MSTAVVIIGNTDNKLTQQEWSRFYTSVDSALTGASVSMEFSGASHGAAPWQNACWVATLRRGVEMDLRHALAQLAAQFEQDSIALLVGETEFVEASR